MSTPDIDSFVQTFTGKRCTVCQALERLEPAERERVDAALAHPRADANRIAAHLSELVGHIEPYTVRRHRNFHG